MSDWPALPYDEWQDTKETLQRWTQVVGKIQLELTPLVNHWWNVTQHVTARGLATAVMPYGDRWFDMEFDFIDHMLRIRTNDGAHRDLALRPRTVADFYREVFAALKSLGIECRIWTVPSEIENPIPLDQDRQHRSYDPKYVQRFWRILALRSS